MSEKMKLVSERKWVWAVDAFHEKPASQWRAVEALRAWEPGGQLSILPVASLSIGQFNPAIRDFEEKWHDLASHAEGNLEALLAQRKEKGILPPRLLRQENPAIAFGVDAVVRFALEQGAEGIVLTSHGRGGPLRFLLGSFAETLVLRCPLPVLIVNPKAARPKRIESIVFPTDFSEGSKEAFQRTLSVASRLKAKIILFHKVSVLYPEMGNAAPGGKKQLDPIAEMKAKLQSQAEQWARFAAHVGVDVKISLDFKMGRVLPSLLKGLERQDGKCLVAMASTSGPTRAVLLGSLSRQVVRHCKQPVLLFHAEQESLSRAFVVQLSRFAYAYAASPLVR